VFGPETTSFLESGCALIVGTVAPDGEPYACRGWGLTVLTPDRTEMRLLLDAEDDNTLNRLETTGLIAITAANVRTFRSIQLKGTAREREAATDADLRRVDDYCDQFFTDVVETDGTDRRYLERLRPNAYVAYTVHVSEVFDQTPGPAAGTSIGARSS
jgi:hypothetical protein